MSLMLRKGVYRGEFCIYWSQQNEPEQQGLNSPRWTRLRSGGVDPSTPHLCCSTALSGRRQYHYTGEWPERGDPARPVILLLFLPSTDMRLLICAPAPCLASSGICTLRAGTLWGHAPRHPLCLQWCLALTDADTE